jgi:ubiquinone/menaquinone biosynthesis C-methylase UbiE
MNDDFKKFQPLGETWEERAKKYGLRPVLDPTDLIGAKNEYIDTLHKIALSKYLSSCKNERILDFGCGIGRLTSFLRKTGAKVIGVDITKEMIEKAKKKYPEETFICYDGGKLPFDDNYFDHIVSVYVLQHITTLDDFYKTAKELVRCLKIGGKIYLIEQVSRKDSDYYLHRLPKDYFEAFKDCKIIEARPIRKSKHLFLSAISRGLIPKFIFPIIAKMELFFVKNQKVPLRGYLDYFFVFQKEK